MPKLNTILIVDDEDVGRQTLEALLYSDNYDLVFAGNGPEAIDAVRNYAPDVILLDVMMPGMDGLEVCQYLKADEQWRHIPIILVTALDSKTDLARGFEAGADDFLSKPVNILELRARVRSLLRLKTQFDELQAMLKLRENLANMVVHDMRSPLTAILGVSELLKSNLASPVNPADVEILHRQVLRLHAFVNDLLTMAKMDSGNLVLSLSLTDIKQLILDIEGGYNIIAQSKGIAFVLDLPDEGRMVPIDINLFQRVLDNLLSNAVKFSRPGGTITLKLEYIHHDDSSKGIRVQVVDEGVGISQNKRELLLDRLEARGEDIIGSPQEVTAQFGFGLAFCKMVVDAHGGHIHVKENEPSGSIFIVEI
ncbi:MAG: response regulator [Anaerolineae bacterium]|nr:response regulator [Anaerolineae bacterium]